ncbi:MAG: ABC transporter permease [Nitrososphaerales archaeon]
MAVQSEVKPRPVVETTNSKIRGFVGILLRRTSSKIGIITLAGIIIFVVVGQLVTPYSPFAATGPINNPPSVAHVFGTDYLGHDVFSEVVFGAFPTFGISLAAAIISVVIGFVVGAFSGYYGKLEGLLGGTTDIVLTFPILPVILLVGELFPATDLLISALLGILLWPPLSRAVRSQVASLKQRPYVEAARTSGVSDFQIVLTIMIPQVIFLAVAYLIINLSIATVVVTAVEFLGVGNPNAVDLGTILYWAQQFAFTAGAWWWFLAPGVLIAVFAIALSLIGFSMEEVLNPRLRK